MKPNIFLFLIFFIFISTSLVSAIGIQGVTIKDEIIFEPNYERTWDYAFKTNAGFTQDYEVYVRMADPENAPDLTQYSTLSQEYFEDIPTNQVIPFKFTLSLPASIDQPGFHELRVGARETQTAGGSTMGARTASEARIKIIVLWDEPFAQTDFVARNGNVNEDVDFEFSLRNFYVGTLVAQGSVDVFDKEDKLLGTVKTASTSIGSTETEIMKATMSTFGLPAGTYTAKAKLKYEDTVKDWEQEFMIGTKTVEILDWTHEVTTGAINKFLLTAKSGWNDPMKDVYAEVNVYKTQSDVYPLTTFQTITTALEPWMQKDIEGYLDATQLEIGDYYVRIQLFFDDNKVSAEGPIKVVERASAQIVTQIPDSDTGSGISMTMILMIVIIILLVVIMGFIGFIFYKKK